MRYLFLLLLLTSGCSDIKHVFDSRFDYKEYPLTIKRINATDEFWCKTASIQDAAVVAFGCMERSYLGHEHDSIVIHESVKISIEKF